MIILAAGLVNIQPSIAQEAKEELVSVAPGTYYGTPFEAKTPVTTAKLHKKLKKAGKKVGMQVEGTVQEVCAKKGCWVNLKLDDGTILFIKMKDYAFFVPKTGLEGKKLLLDGEGYKEVFSVEELQHYAMDAGKSKEEAAKITEPEEKLRFTARGIKVLN